MEKTKWFKNTEELRAYVKGKLDVTMLEEVKKDKKKQTKKGKKHEDIQTD